LYALENYGSDALLDLFYSAALETLKTTHRVVMTTSGRLIRYIPSPPEWMQTYVEDYKQTVFETIRQIIDSNEDFRQFFDHMSRLLSELLRENSANIQWSAVRESARGVRDIVFSRKAFQSSHRVLVWDPKRGHISLELRAPGPLVHSRRLRSVMNDMKKSWKSAEPIKKWQKKWQQIKEYVKSMF